MSVDMPSVDHSEGERNRLLLATVDRIAREVDPHARARHRLSLASRLDRDLGLDSLSRAELVLRLERIFAVNLPDAAIEAETPQALLALLELAPSRTESAPRAGPEEMQETVAERPDDAASLNEVMAWHVERHPDRVHLKLLDEVREERALTFRELDEAARLVAGGLQARGVRPGSSVALMLPTSIDYFQAFFGTLYAGAVPVPIYPPTRPSQFEEHIRRHGRIMDTSASAIMITVPEARPLARLLHAEAPALRAFVSVQELMEAGVSAEPMHSPADALALLQFTSGSTGDPKGVMLTHGDLLANIRAMGRRLEVTSEDVIVSWLPLYHDMGLIGAWLGSLYFSATLVVMSPLAFLSHPTLWLETIHRHRGSISGGPNFGFEFCLRALDPRDITDLDLSCWRVAFNGAEPVSPATLDRFQQSLSICGFPANALTPVYGLAEAGVGLCLPAAGRGPIIDRVDAEIFAGSGRAVPSENADAASFVNCGPALAGYEVRIVDDDGHEQPDRQEGHVQFRGPSATRGYFRRRDLSEELFDGEWLRTGDRGYLVAGDIHVTGRVKDMIVRGGRNIYPYELETAVGAVEGVRKGCVAAFGNTDSASGIEQLVIVAETRETQREVRQRIEADIREASVAAVNVPADDIVLVSPHSVPKTSSGKIRRSTTRELYQNGRLGAQGVGVKWQLARLAAASLRNHLRNAARRMLAYLYAGFAWTLFALAATATALAIVLLPTLASRWKAAHYITRAAQPVSGLRLNVNGLENLPREMACVLVANHASYIDPVLLAAALPGNFRFLAKAELKERPLVGWLLKRFGVLFVQRFDPHQATEDTRRVLQAAECGDSLAIFPEGTFTRGSGLGSFHMGAFVTAADAHVPILPVALKGTRSVLRGDEWFPRPGRVEVVIGEPLTPRGKEWKEAVRLRNKAREFILRHCGEPDALAE